MIRKVGDKNYGLTFNVTVFKEVMMWQEVVLFQ